MIPGLKCIAFRFHFMSPCSCIARIGIAISTLYSTSHCNSFSGSNHFHCLPMNFLCNTICYTKGKPTAEYSNSAFPMVYKYLKENLPDQYLIKNQYRHYIPHCYTNQSNQFLFHTDLLYWTGSCCYLQMELCILKEGSGCGHTSLLLIILRNLGPGTKRIHMPL